MDSSLEDIDAVFLDLDGTIYLGGDLIDGALDFLARCDDFGVRRYFLSNNSSRSVDQYVAKLAGLEFPQRWRTFCCQHMICSPGWPQMK